MARPSGSESVIQFVGKKKQFGFGINKDSGSGKWFGQRPRKRDLKIGTEKSVVPALDRPQGVGMKCKDRCLAC